MTVLQEFAKGTFKLNKFIEKKSAINSIILLVYMKK